MATTTIPISKNAVVSMLKNIPEKMLADIFWDAFVAIDASPLSKGDKTALEKARTEFKKGETIKWQDI
jgi:hypothetical protein